MPAVQSTLSFEDSGVTPVDARDYWLGAALALLLSSQAVLVLCFGLVGVQANSLFTGLFFSSSLVAVFLLSDWRDFAVRDEDYLFATLALCVLASFAWNSISAPPKEIALLLISLAAYPAFRCVRLSRLDGALNSFIWTTGIIVGVGAVMAAVALFQQWDDQHGKPFVFGFSDAAPTHFLMSLGFLLLALVHRGLTAKSTMIISGIVFLSAVVFSASLVRFMFVAIVLTLCVAAALATSIQRKYIALIILVIAAGIGTGQAARHNKAMVMASYLFEVSLIRPMENAPMVPPSCSTDVNLNNSIATRKALLRDAVFLIPSAGLTGIGLDSFMKFSCIKGTEVHNSILQATVEFGWLGGLALALMIVVSIWRLSYSDSRFAFYGLIYIALISMAHGRISRDTILFAFVGIGLASEWRRKKIAN